MQEALFASGKEYAGHDEHALDPAEDLYVPESQSAQLVEPANEYFPAAQSEHALLPIWSAYFPAGQNAQEALPRLFLYVPAGHAVHDVPSGPVYPSLQTQSAIDMLLAGDVLCVGHVMQAPGHSAYCPAAQLLQGAETETQLP